MVYDKPHAGQVRNTGWSMQKWSWVKLFCFFSWGFLGLVFSENFVRFEAGWVASDVLVIYSLKGRFLRVGGGDDERAETGEEG